MVYIQKSWEKRKKGKASEVPVEIRKQDSAKEKEKKNCLVEGNDGVRMGLDLCTFTAEGGRFQCLNRETISKMRWEHNQINKDKLFEKKGKRKKAGSDQ